MTRREIADEVMARGIIAQIALRHTTRVLKKDLKLHLIRYWLTQGEDAYKQETARAICTVFEHATQLAQKREHHDRITCKDRTFIVVCVLLLSVFFRVEIRDQVHT